MSVMLLSNHYITTQYSHGVLTTFMIYIYFQVEPIAGWRMSHAWPPLPKDLQWFVASNATLYQPRDLWLSRGHPGLHREFLLSLAFVTGWSSLLLQNWLRRSIGEFVSTKVNVRGEASLGKLLVAIAPIVCTFITESYIQHSSVVSHF
jgi:hypothetical protein